MATTWQGILSSGINTAASVIGSLETAGTQQAALTAQQNIAATNAALAYQTQQLKTASSSSTMAYLAIIVGGGLVVYILFFRKK